jgi:hypothetical protein
MHDIPPGHIFLALPYPRRAGLGFAGNEMKIRQRRRSLQP